MATANEIAMLNAARNAGITSRDELANFMAQVSHESGGLSTLEESFRYTRGIDAIPVQSAFREGREALESARLEALAGRPQELARLMYGGRMGNDDAGDGYLYRGRGFVMLTGEDNYRARGEAVGLDLVGSPDLAADPDHASRIAVSYWQDRVPQADRDDVSAATRAINGGENGLADRYSRFDAWYAQLTPEFMAELAAGRVQPGTRVAPLTGQDAMADGTLRRGESGTEVGQLQTNLRALGIHDARDREISVDETFNRSTEQAVRRFQEQEHLAITGRADPDTLAAIQQAVARQEQQNRVVPKSLPSDHGRRAAPSSDEVDRLRLIEGDRRPTNEIPTGLRSGGDLPAFPAPAETHGMRTTDPRDREHPDHDLDRRIRSELARAETAIGKSWDDNSERLAASLYGLAKEKGFDDRDALKVAFNERTATRQGGEIAFLFREGGTASHDPYANRAQIATREALAQPAEDHYRRADEQSQVQQQAQLLAQQQESPLQQREAHRSL